MYDKAAVMEAMKKKSPPTPINYHSGPIPYVESSIRAKLNGLFKCRRCDTMQYFKWDGRSPDVQSVACWSCEKEDRMEKL